MADMTDEEYDNLDERWTETLGLVDAERFISLILREPFDYTEWQQDLYKGVSLDDFYRNVKNFRDAANVAK